MTITQSVSNLEKGRAGEGGDLLSVVWQRRERVLEAIAHVQIVVDDCGLHLIASEEGTTHVGKSAQSQVSRFSRDFASLPDSFGRAFLHQQVKDFLYETFCLGERSPINSTTIDSAHVLAANDELGGGIHAELLNRMNANNHGQGYFDPDWTVVEEMAEELAVAKHGVVIYVDRQCHLEDTQRQARANDAIAIRLSEYRFEPGFYVAIGNLGPAIESDSVEFYIAANAAAAAVILDVVTQSLNAAGAAAPYSLRLPYQLAGYCAEATGAETVVLRTVAGAKGRAIAALEEIVRVCNYSESISLEALREPDWDKPTLRFDLPVFTCPLWPGVSMAEPERDCSDWFGGWADRDCCNILARVLVAHWEDALSAQGRENRPLLKLRLADALEASGFGWQRA